MQNIRNIFIFFTFLIFGISCQRADNSNNQEIATPIRILCEEGPWSDHLQKMVDSYTQQTGKHVLLSVRKKETYRNEFSDEMKLRSDQFHIALIDPLWLPYGVKNGYFIEFTSWLSKNKLDDYFNKNLQKTYTEYPLESGKVWGIPASYDVMGLVYRKDFFEGPLEQKLFEEKFHRKLSPPENVSEFLDLVSYFYRPESRIYPLADFTKKSFGELSALFSAFVVNRGGVMVDSPNPTARGFLNSKGNVETLEMIKGLYRKSSDAQDGKIFGKNNRENQVVMGFETYSTFQKMVSHHNFNRNYGFIPFFKNSKGQRSTIEGRILVAIGFAPNKDQTFEFLEWFLKEENQAQWSKMGEISPTQNILGGPSFYLDGMYRRELMQGIDGGQRFLMLPEYFDLVGTLDEDLKQYFIKNDLSASSVLKKIAVKWEYIFEQAGYYKE